MARKPTQHVSRETVELESTVELLEIEDNLFAFRRRLTASTPKPVLLAAGVAAGNRAARVRGPEKRRQAGQEQTL